MLARASARRANACVSSCCDDDCFIRYDNEDISARSWASSLSMIVGLSAAVVIFFVGDNKEEDGEDEERLLSRLLISLVPAVMLLLGDGEDSDCLNDESNRV
jgi:hypothetical protein